MGVVEPRNEEDLTALQLAVRSHNAHKLRTLIEHLEPQVDGSYGPVNPRMVEVYMKALDQLGKLYRVYDRPPPRQDELVPELSAAQLRAKVLRELDELAGRQLGA